MRQGIKTTMIAGGTFFVGVIVGVSGGGSDSGTAAAAGSPSTSTVTVTSNSTAPGSVSTVTAPAKTVTAPAKTVTVKAKPPAPKHTIEDGDWTVGEDFPVGTYKVTSNIEGDCYWEITKSGSNGGNIIANDIPAGGRPKIVLKTGEDFSTEGCGTWAKQ